MRVAVVLAGVVDNVLLADSVQQFSQPPWPDVFPDCTFHAVGTDPVGPGWSFDGTEFTPPAPPDPGPDAP